ncbi:protein max isoform X2 [Phlebotomus argentipes]|uniref:protein max isoform X2 n=1 Tax=Phlebotomus argentipes TaxID=94469 RepID=UPI002892CE5D|nr:protein max isoform X2 [Phlebotomus argentipes]
MKYYEESASAKNRAQDKYDAMSDDDRDIDIESDEDNDSDGTRHQQRNSVNSQYCSQAEKRAHHNALERKRRDHIKDSFTSLRDSVPSLQGEKASRAQILKKAAEYIQFMRRKNHSHHQDIEDLKKQNNVLEAQIRQLERARANGATFNGSESGEMNLNVNNSKADSSRGSESSSDAEESNLSARRNKKLKTSGSFA